MLSIIRTSMLPLGQGVVRSLVSIVTIGRHISISKNCQNSEPIFKTNKIVGMPINLDYKQKFGTADKTFSTLNISRSPTVFQSQAQDFMAVFPDIVAEFACAINEYDARSASKWYSKVLEYNVPYGKKTRGALVPHIYKALTGKDQQTPGNIKKAHYLAFLIWDDIIDGSRTRRDRLCWYKLKNVGLTAINDAAMVEAAIYSVLRANFRQTDSYTHLLELFHQATTITISGGSLDILASRESIINFTMEMYHALARNKSGYYSFYLPFALGMHLAGIEDREIYRQVETVLIKMGTFYQIQDDFLDCFGNPEVTGKIGTDIQDNKCSWLAVVCMQRANADQRKIMVECYGQDDPVKITRVKDLYVELDLPNTYATYEKESYSNIKEDIQQVPSVALQESILHLLDMMYRRDS